MNSGAVESVLADWQIARHKRIALVSATGRTVPGVLAVRLRRSGDSPVPGWHHLFGPDKTTMQRGQDDLHCLSSVYEPIGQLPGRQLLPRSYHLASGKLWRYHKECC